MDIRKIARALAWLVAGCLLLFVLLYLALVAINWSDEAPSEDVATLQRHLDTPPVADADNGYVYALGLIVAEEQDPVEQGGRRREFLERFGPADTDQSGFAIAGERSGYAAARSSEITALKDACRRGGADCARLLERTPETLVAWKTSEGWLLARYRQLIQRTQWRETVPGSFAAPLPAYQHLLSGQDLLLLEAWQHAVAGDVAGVHERLEQDLRFWRTVLRSSNLLISKMIAVAAIDRHFAIGNLALRALPADRQADAIPPLWHEPISREERALYRAFAGEFRFSNAAIQVAAKPSAIGEITGIGVIDWMVPQFFKIQATVNLSARGLLATARDFDTTEFSQLPEVMRERTARQDTLRSVLHPYNPVGRILIDVAVPAYVGYGPRAADLEGTRRAALLAATLRSEGIDAAHAQAAVAASALTDPYTGKPLQWDADSASVVFTGLAKGERQRAAILR